MRHGCMLLQREMSIAFIEEYILPNHVRLGKSALGVTELQVNLFMNIAAIAIFVNARTWFLERLFDRPDSLQSFVFHNNRIGRLNCRIFIYCGNRRHRITDHANLFNAECMFILADRENPIWDGQVTTRDNRHNTWNSQSFRRIDPYNSRMRQWAAQEFGKEHAWKLNVVGITSLPRTLRTCIHFTKVFSDYFERGRASGRVGERESGRAVGSHGHQGSR